MKDFSIPPLHPPTPKRRQAAQGTCSGLFLNSHRQESLPAGIWMRSREPGWVALGWHPHPPEPVGSDLTPQGYVDS